MTARATRAAALPPGMVPLGLDRVEAAAYVGLSPSKFDTLVLTGAMPRPKEIGARRVWSRVALDKAFSALPDATIGGRSDDEYSDDIWGRPAV